MHTSTNDLTSQRVVEAAMSYAARGWCVHPTIPNDKKPILTEWQHRATTDEDQITEWWNAKPRAGVGVVLGPRSGIVDVETDNDQGEATLFKEYLADREVYPPTFTSSRGTHRLFKYTDELPPQAKKDLHLEPGAKIEVLIGGGEKGAYSIFPPTVAENKAREWLPGLSPDDVDPPELPAEILQRLNAPPPREGDGQPTRDWITLLEGVPEGKRHEATLSLVGAMLSNARNLNAKHSELLFGQIRAVNQNNKPPLPEAELRSIFNDVIGKERKKRHKGDGACDLIRSAKLVRMADVEPQPVEWLWPGRIALGKLTLLAGDPGVTKSFLSLDIASRISRGYSWPDSDERSPPGGVVILTAEDDLDDTVRPRLDAATADPRRIVALEAVEVRGDDDKPTQAYFSLKSDLPILEEAITKTPECRLAIIDPVSAYLGDVDSHRNADIRGLLGPLADLARRLKVAILGVTHLNKSGATPALYRTTGSLAFVAASRAVWLVAKDPDEPKRKLMLSVKNNLAEDVAGLAYTIVDGALAWERDPVDTKPDEALATRDPKNPTKTEECVNFLRELLAAGGGAGADDVHRLCQAAGFSHRTVMRARERLGVISKKTGFQGAWELHLADPDE